MPLLICLGIDNYAYAQTVDTRPFFLGRVGPENEAKSISTSTGCRSWGGTLIKQQVLSAFIASDYYS